MTQLPVAIRRADGDPGAADLIAGHDRTCQGGVQQVTLQLMDDRSARIASLLHEAGETHHLLYRIVDGDDPDWASWYADWLIHLSELPQILGTAPVRSELVWLLVNLDSSFVRFTTRPYPIIYFNEIASQQAPLVAA